MDLDFKSSDTSYSTHCFHTYPAKMIPQIAKAILDEFVKDKKGGILFDPYCGTGTSLVEGNLHGLNSIGTDLNPLARLIASTKTTPIEIQSLDLHLSDFYNYLFRFRFGLENPSSSIVIPDFQNIDFWFSRSVKKSLSIIHQYIGKIENQPIKSFFQVAFSQTIRECSWSRKNEFKLYKMSKERVKAFKPDPFSVFEKTLGRNRNGLLEFMTSLPSEVSSVVEEFNSTHGIPKRLVPEGSVDIVLSSPPYGDSSTTVAYGQFSAHANQWLGFLENGRALDKELMGGQRRKKLVKFSCPELNDQIEEISKKDRKRALDVVSFFKDYNSSIRNVSNVVKRGGIVCYVVSNRTVRGVKLKTSDFTRKMFEENGFSHLETFQRAISSKRMPRKNSSVGIEGKKSDLMNKEYVVVLKKA